MKILFKLLCIIAVIFVAVHVKEVRAQVRYEDVIERIHYTDPNRMGWLEGETPKPQEELKFIGAKNPTVKIYIYANPINTFTAKFFGETFETLKKNHMNDVQFLFKYNYLDFDGDDAIKASIIAECAARQGQFWNNILPIANNKNHLDDLTYLINVNISQIKICLVDPIIKSTVTVQRDDAKLFGFNSVPVFIIKNVKETKDFDIKINGAQNITIFDQAIKEATGNNSPEQLKAKLDSTQKELAETKKEVTFLEQQLSNLQNLFNKVLKTFHLK